MLIDINALEPAQDTLDQADALLKDTQKTASLLNTKGVLLMKQEDYARAEETLLRGLDLVSQDDPASLATLNFSLGRLMIARNQLDQAHTYFQAALHTDRQLGFHRGIADDLAALGDLYQKQAQHKTAADYFQRGIKVYALIGDKIRVDATLQQLREAATEADVDIRVTELFVERWLEGKVLEIPCN